VQAINNYDSFWTNPEVTDYYMDTFRYIQDTNFEGASRYSTKGFTRTQLAKLEARQVRSKIVHNYQYEQIAKTGARNKQGLQLTL